MCQFRWHGAIFLNKFSQNSQEFTLVRVNGVHVGEFQSNPVGGATGVQYARRSADGISAAQSNAKAKTRR